LYRKTDAYFDIFGTEVSAVSIGIEKVLPIKYRCGSDTDINKPEPDQVEDNTYRLIITLIFYAVLEFLAILTKESI